MSISVSHEMHNTPFGGLGGGGFGQSFGLEVDLSIRTIVLQLTCCKRRKRARVCVCVCNRESHCAKGIESILPCQYYTQLDSSPISRKELCRPFSTIVLTGIALHIWIWRSGQVCLGKQISRLVLMPLTLHMQDSFHR